MTHRSPFARKARIALREKGLACEEILVDLAHKPPALVASGPIQKVPVLNDGGLTIVDSAVIVAYLEERYPAVRLFPYGPLQRADARMWEQAASELSEAAIKMFMDRAKPAALQDRAGVAKARGLLERLLDYGEQTAAGREFLVAQEFGIADIAFASAVGYVEFRLGGGWRAARPNLVRYYERIAARPSFADTKPRA